MLGECFFRPPYPNQGAQRALALCLCFCCTLTMIDLLPPSCLELDQNQGPLGLMVGGHVDVCESQRACTMTHRHIPHSVPMHGSIAASVHLLICVCCNRGQVVGNLGPSPPAMYSRYHLLKLSLLSG